MTDSNKNNQNSAQNKAAWDSALEALGIKRIKDPGWQALSMLVPGDETDLVATESGSIIAFPVRDRRKEEA